MLMLQLQYFTRRRNGQGNIPTATESLEQMREIENLNCNEARERVIWGQVVQRY